MHSNARASVLGLVWCGLFVALDAAQAVYFGGALQRVDGFLLGALAFGLPAAGCVAWTLARRRAQWRAALADAPALIGLNVCSAGAWLTYLLALQRIEPAVAFTLFTGVIPLTTIVAARGGFPEAEPARNALEAAGNVTLALGMALLAVFTLAGWSGFVRGGAAGAAWGLALSALAGALIAGMLLYSKRLDRSGVGPVAQFGLRFPLYLVLAVAGWLLGLDHKGPVAVSELALAVTVGLLLLAFPIYAVQKAVSLCSSLTVATAAALTPLVVFAMQAVEGRVQHAPATALGLAVCFLGAATAALGGARASTRRAASARTNGARTDGSQSGGAQIGGTRNRL